MNLSSNKSYKQQHLPNSGGKLSELNAPIYYVYTSFKIFLHKVGFHIYWTGGYSFWMKIK